MSNTWIGPTLPPSMARDRSIGPTLPPHFKSTQSNSEQTSLGSDDIVERGIGSTPLGNPNSNCNNEDLDGAISPSLPPNLRRSHLPEGPSLPPKSTQKDSDLEDEGAEETYGPSLPPAYTSKQNHILGPSLPPGFRRPCEGEVGEESDEESEDDSSEEEVIGPMPASEHDYRQGRSAAEELEARAAAMKNKLTKKEEDVLSRDSWMTELPEFSKSFGMGPRTFRKNARPDEKDRSGWTETPADRAKKEQERFERAAAAEQSSSSKSSKKKKKDKEFKMSERDRGMADEVKKHNERARSESLMDIHSKNRKRKMEEEQGSSENERRPFDRETDLQVNRFDDARRKQLLKKSAHLGEKFSHSSEKAYL